MHLIKLESVDIQNEQVISYLIRDHCALPQNSLKHEKISRFVRIWVRAAKQNAQSAKVAQARIMQPCKLVS